MADPEYISIYEQEAPGMFVFGSNGAGELLAIDLRGKTPPWPIVYFDGINPEGSPEKLIDRFSEFILDR